MFKCTARDFNSKNKEGILQDDGTAKWQNEEKRLSIKFKNKPCLSCKLLPVCNGGCSQVALENEGKDYCVYDFDESKKEAVILEVYFMKIWAVIFLIGVFAFIGLRGL